ncbi:hypothetical protein MSG28_007100 [Choristoneura fumiferana]|uniref:Uncharacterized protein n=1 Tax=Choristoneura fumiferana TaxID=7141 RepID=A0ACC0JMH7_CHOFU|nr:hypothetical protein MSG28_007100 [Choristoneura fumiferana]
MAVAVRAVLLCACAMLLHSASAELLGRCPAQAACPARAAPCASDDDCGERACCDTACGKTCVDPLYTGCENIRLSSERISRALAAENSRGGRGLIKSVRAPRCRTSDGEFEEIQCDNEIVSSCWCVDQAGFEVPGTRAPAAALVNCTRKAPCAAHTCRMLCPLGFELDARGCPLCKCRDPCAGVTCPGQLSCQLEETPCLRPPCPPVPNCKRARSLQNICPAGEPLLISETSRPFLCGTDPGKPNCPPLYKCLVESGNDYGVCCPASLELRKAGTCPAPTTSELDCGAPCAHDLECPSMQKCCDGGECGKHCVLPQNVTMCNQQKMLAELLVISEKEGRGYVPQCTKDGSFESRQCVDTEGNKLRGSMGPAPSVQCSETPRPARSGGRSLDSCARALCAGVCEYGYKSANGCPTCECDDPCEGFPCPDGEECIRVKDADCTGELCTGYPVCRPRVSYENPCEVGVPATDDDGSVVGCGSDQDCPSQHVCTRTRRSGAALCCPDPKFDNATDSDSNELNMDSCGPEAEAVCDHNSTVSCADGTCEDGLVCCGTSCGPMCVDVAKMRLQTDRVDDTPTTHVQKSGLTPEIFTMTWMPLKGAGSDSYKVGNTSNPRVVCEYLRDFDEKMEGTVDGMKLALPAPTCAADGSFAPQQCARGRCWCVDSFGTEIPDTSTNNASAVDCEKLREQLACLDLTCRMGCDYGFELGSNRCPTCRCRDPCAGVACPEGRACAVVDVACDADYCPPLPGTRVFNTTPSCDAPAPCPEPRCNEEEICAHGRQLDSQGCPTCECRDLCAEAKCRPDETCEIVPLECEADSCPPIVRCTPTPQCPEGEPLQVPGGTDILTCGPNAAACPSTHACRFAPHDTRPPVCCPKPRTVCFDGKDDGNCTTTTTTGLNVTRWHFNHERNRCERFKYHGCSGNHNNFRSKEECNAVCPVLSPCERLREKNEIAEKKYGKGTFIPKCDVSGAWESVQCMTHIDVCWCVSSRGEPLKGSLVRGAKPSCNFRQARKWAPRDPMDEKARADEVLEELIRQMTAYRIEEFEEYDEEMELGSHNDEPLDDANDDLQAREPEEVARGEVVEPRLVDSVKLLDLDVPEKTVFKTKCQLLQEEAENGVDGPRPRCLADGSFSPRQCARGRCWCVDAAGQRRSPANIPDVPAPDPCQSSQALVDSARPRCLTDGSFSPRQYASSLPAPAAAESLSVVTLKVKTHKFLQTQVDSASLELEIIGTDVAAGERARVLLSTRLAMLGARVPVVMSRDKSTTRLRAMLAGPRAADIVYHVENLVKQEKLSGGNQPGALGADVIRSEYRLAAPAPLVQREILSESTVSAATSYHTALIVLAASSAFIISVLCVLVMLYRGRLQREPHKAERFMPPAPPVYVLSADEKAELAMALHPPLPIPPEPDNTRV